jgi:hypothetical protein
MAKHCALIAGIASSTFLWVEMCESNEDQSIAAFTLEKQQAEEKKSHYPVTMNEHPRPSI